MMHVPTTSISATPMTAPITAPATTPPLLELAEDPLPPPPPPPPVPGVDVCDCVAWFEKVDVVEGTCDGDAPRERVCVSVCEADAAWDSDCDWLAVEDGDAPREKDCDGEPVLDLDEDEVFDCEGDAESDGVPESDTLAVRDCDAVVDREAPSENDCDGDELDDEE
jgi:hypothetical protein